MEIERIKNEETQETTLSNLLPFQTICRLCANTCDKLISIYGEDGLGYDLGNKINSYLPIKVSKEDILPLQCCWNCASTLLAWHELVVSTVEVDKRFKNYQFESEKNEKDHKQIQQLDIQSADLATLNLDTLCPIDDKKEIPKDNTIEQSIPSKPEFPTDPQNPPADEKSYKYECPYCNIAYLSENDIVVHLRNAHDVDNDDGDVDHPTPTRTTRKNRRHAKINQELVDAAKIVVEGRIYYNCKDCGKSLHSPYTFMWHMRIHTGERPFVCDLCGKQFRVSQGLVRHLKETHEGIKNFACDLCGRMFATRRNVEEHRRIHTNERPYVCDLCGKAFKQKASLFVHNRSHNDHFPFNCSYCSQSFRTKPSLMVHITRHTGEKPHKCEECGRCFRIKYELKRHTLIHSDVKPFTCDLCGLAFRQKRYLRNHNKSNHTMVATV